MSIGVKGLLLAGVAAGIAVCGPVYAQTAPAPASDSPTASPPQDDQSGVPDIVITAERRTSTIQKTAIAVSAIGGAEIQERQLNTIGEVLTKTPAVVITNSTKGQAIFIRGIGSTGDAQEGGDPAVNLNIDGVYEQQALVPLASSFDVNRIEVLRGPQGTLYGRNSNAGSINIITNDPVIGENSGYFNLQLGNYRAVRAEAAGNVALTDTIAARIAFATNRHAGYYSNGGGSGDGVAVRGKLKFQPNDALSLTIAGLYASELGSPQATVPAPLNQNDPYNTTYPAYNGQNGNPFFPPLAAAPTVVPKGVQNTKFAQVYGRLDYNFGFATLTVLPAFSYTKQYQDSALLPFGAAAQLTTEYARSFEARLASDAASKVTWLIGVYGYSADDHRNPFPAAVLQFPHAPVVFPANQAVLYTSRTYAAFGQLTVPVTDSFRLTGGARYTHDRKGIVFDYFTSPTASTAGPSYRNSYSTGTYKGGFEFDLSKRALLYGQVSNGFKAGGVNPNGTSYAPEKITAYEGGLKTRFFNGAVQFNLSGYYYAYSGYQARVNTPDCTDPNGFSQQTINAAKLKNYGGEAELSVSPTPRDRFSASASYLNSRGRFKYDNGICSAGVVTHAYLDLVETPPNSPRWSGLVSYAHRFDLWNESTLSARVDLRWSSSYDTAIDQSIFDTQGKFTRTDASVTYALPGERLSVRFYIKNIENKVQKLFTLAPPIPFAALEISDPRTYGVALSAKF